MDINKKKYISIFLITLGIFASVFLVVSLINKSKNENIADLQRKITVDLIANETQFDLLKNAPCKAIEGESVLSRQMSELGKKLVHAEEIQGGDNKHVLELKKYYSLLEVKDYLLSQEVAQKCDIQIESIIYFYENDCNDCEKQGYVLTELKRKYPWLRIYSFDKNLDFSIVKTFSALYELDDKTPIIVIDGETYSGFKSVEEIEEYIPALREKKELEEAKKNVSNFIKDDSRFEDKNIEFVSYEDGVYVYSYSDTEDSGKKELKLSYDKENDEISFMEEVED
jgi:hypothetical protein